MYMHHISTQPPLKIGVIEVCSVPLISHNYRLITIIIHHRIVRRSRIDYGDVYSLTSDPIWNFSFAMDMLHRIPNEIIKPE